MAKETDLARPRIDLKSDRGGGCRDEPIDYQGQVNFRRCQYATCHGSNLEPSNDLQPITSELTGGSNRMALNRPPDNVNLAGQNHIANPSPAPYGFRRTEPAEHGQQTGRSGCIPDTHLTDSQHVHPIGVRPMDLFASDADRPLTLLPRHGRLVQKASSTAPDRPDKEVLLIGDFLRPISIDSGINDLKIDPGMTGEHVDGGSSLQEIQYHLRCHLTWISADTLSDYSMRTCVNADPFPGDPWF